jgi:hypothetical protein
LGISIAWLPVGVLSGWSMENSASGILILLAAYFIVKFRRKEHVALFEITGTLSFAAGFFMLILARGSIFPGFLGLIWNSIKFFWQFLLTDGFLCTLVVILGVEHAVHKKRKIPIAAYGYFTVALASAAAMVIPGYFGDRSCFFTQLLLIITGLSLVGEIARYVPKRYMLWSFMLVFLVFLRSFYNGTKSIVKSWLLSSAREYYILTEKAKGSMNIQVKAPIPVEDPHSGLYGGIDVLTDPDDRQYRLHNGAKATWYGIQTLDGIRTEAKGLKISFSYYVQHRKDERLAINDLWRMIYDNW